MSPAARWIVALAALLLLSGCARGCGKKRTGSLLARKPLGARVLGPLVVRLTEERPRPAGIAVDAEWVYWGELGSNDGPGGWDAGDGAILRARKDATGMPEVVAEGVGTPKRLRADATHVYWIDDAHMMAIGKDRMPTPSHVSRAPVAGGAVETLMTFPSSYPVDLRLDATHVYWVADSGDVWRWEKSTKKTDLVGPRVGAASEGATALALDDGGFYLTLAGSGAIAWRPKAGGDAKRSRTDGLCSPFGIEVAGPDVAWACQTGQLTSQPRAGGPRKTHGWTQGGWGFTARDRLAYWGTISTTAEIYCGSLEDTRREVMFSGERGAHELAVDDRWLFVTARRAGTVLRIDRAACPIR